MYQDWSMVEAQAEYIEAMSERRDAWVVGGCGTETPYICGGRWTLYVYNPATGEHGFLDMATDMVYDTPNNI